jgi:hypothetical protein
MEHHFRQDNLQIYELGVAKKTGKIYNANQLGERKKNEINVDEFGAGKAENEEGLSCSAMTFEQGCLGNLKDFKAVEFNRTKPIKSFAEREKQLFLRLKSKGLQVFTSRKN